MVFVGHYFGHRASVVIEDAVALIIRGNRNYLVGLGGLWIMMHGLLMFLSYKSLLLHGHG